MASRLQAARTRLAKFLEAGPPPEKAREQSIRMQLGGARTGKRAVVCEQLELDGLTYPFDLEVWFGDRVAVLGANGTGKSHFLRLLAPRRHRSRAGLGARERRGSWSPVAHAGVARLGARVRPGHFSQTHDRPELVGRTLLEVLVEGDVDRGRAWRGPTRCAASPATSSPGRPTSGSARSPAASRPGCRSCCWSCSGATLLLLDEPTDNLDLASRRGTGAGARRVRRHGARGDPRPLVHPRLRPLRGVRGRRRGARDTGAGLGVGRVSSRHRSWPSDRRAPAAPTATSRTSMNAASPDQIPASPHPNASDAQISGRNPTTAAARVEVRRNAASPAPSSTPSIANTTPATGCSAAKNHQATGTAASTAASGVNTGGSTPDSAANSTPNPTPSTSP